VVSCTLERWISSFTNKVSIHVTFSGRTIFQMLGMFAEFERAIMVEGVDGPDEGQEPRKAKRTIT
jgi:hypothetical protein